MRFFTLLSFTLLTYANLQAQVVFVNSPASISGSYEFSSGSSVTPAWGADVSSGVWTADAVFVDDGSANPTQGCSTLVNAAEIAGKIALIDRGSCEFGQKALNAEQAGAIAVIIFNSAANAGLGPALMGAGAVGAQVTIPVVSLSYEDGQAIRNVLATETVNITIGKLVFPNDLRINDQSVLRPVNGTMPLSQIEDTGYPITPGIAVVNAGANTVESVEVTATIEFLPDGSSTPQQVYEETVSLAGPILTDSAGAILLPEYDASQNGVGKYVITYSVEGDSTDEFPADNVATVEFFVTEDLFSKGTIDPATNELVVTNAYTIDGGGDIEFLAGFHVPEGDGFVLDSVMFYVSTASTTLEGKDVVAYLYRWDDLSLDSTINNDELEIVALTNYTFEDTTDALVQAPLFDLNTGEAGYQIPAGEQNFVLGIRYTGDTLVYIGFDETYDQTLRVDSGLLVSDLDYPYIGVNAWDPGTNLPDVENGFLFAGFRGALAAALIINELETASPETFADAATVRLFPNPVASRLQVEVTLRQPSGFIEYAIRDASGRLFLQTRTEEGKAFEQAQFDVNDLPAGQYFLEIRSENGGVSKGFSVKR